jgi:hypothetical protein
LTESSASVCLLGAILYLGGDCCVQWGFRRLLLHDNVPRFGAGGSTLAQQWRMGGNEPVMLLTHLVQIFQRSFVVLYCVEGFILFATPTPQHPPTFICTCAGSRAHSSRHRACDIIHTLSSLIREVPKLNYSAANVDHTDPPPLQSRLWTLPTPKRAARKCIQIRERGTGTRFVRHFSRVKHPRSDAATSQRRTTH